MRDSYCGITTGNGWMRNNPDLLYPEKHENMTDAELYNALHIKPRGCNGIITIGTLKDIVERSLLKANETYNLNMCFDHHSDLVCEIVWNKLSQLNIDAELVDGQYQQKLSETETRTLSHCWLVLPQLELLIDPTRSQFGFENPILEMEDDENLKNYKW
ncbi:hypothetical protein [Photobacterium damselae]|uniref:hypothetical protein n=1 Tax=Photobacterium damselae TaxID=38293 RepID=UPI0040690AE5